ncbi:mast cell protease 4-like [Triplophysa dalaica]|uniref:mast cell protease 4-like n=1 Tax=Triplophysa dalaica TaxID=1582913 RepID=UPI0024DF886C|nr:mast cell protease 4-like [Triplophysa dalaica]
MIFSLLLLGALLPHMTLTAYVNVGIVNGTEAKAHSRPYMVSIQKGGKHICGGFLVSEQFVMSAAHCYTDGDKLTVVVGAHDLGQSSRRMDVEVYNIHPEYDSIKGLNDIMILKLDGTTKNMKNVKSISIPNKEEDIKAGSKCSVAGWGRKTTNGSGTDRLMEVDVTVIDTKACERYGIKHSQGMYVHLVLGKLGDSGGPLVCKDTAVGVVSFGEKNNCDKPTKPNVYTKISSFLPWVKAILKGVKQDLD